MLALRNCSNDFSVLSEERNSYSFGWLSGKNNHSNNTENAFSFKSDQNLIGIGYFGKYTYYTTGGYYFPFMGSYNETISSINELAKFKWINEQTRAIFIDFVLYNPNVNLFTYCKVLYEILPSGNILSTFQVNVIDLYDLSNNFKTFRIAFFGLLPDNSVFDNKKHKINSEAAVILFKTTSKLY